MKHTSASLVLSDSFEDSSEENSGVRVRAPSDVLLAFGADPREEPAAVYALVPRDSGWRSYYIGTLFPLGVIPAVGWSDDMERDGVPARFIDGATDWLTEHAI